MPDKIYTMEEQELPCEHGRQNYKGCPHCLGLNNMDKIYTREELINRIETLSERFYEDVGATPKFLISVDRVKDYLNFAIDETLRLRDAEIEKLIVEEINICQREGTPTSRLTSLAMKIKGIQ